MRIVVTGGAGFLGSHLCDALIERADTVVCVDDMSTGRTENIDHLYNTETFEFIQANICEGLTIDGPVDAVAHLASPASPAAYLKRPLETLDVNSSGTKNALELALQKSARFLLASTSEVYGDPMVHPQPEEYRGNVSPIGTRSVYDEGKRFAEALASAYRRHYGLDAGIVRIFNTYGPRMGSTDGRVVTNFIMQALAGDPLTVYGDGSQTRSFCYVSDLVQGLLLMLDSSVAGPLNLGNPEERQIIELADMVRQITGSDSLIEFCELPADDPTRRRPAIDRAMAELGWRPTVTLTEGIQATSEWLAGSRDFRTSASGQSGPGRQGLLSTSDGVGAGR
jgi:dTDP-glucose 4,6-dehydratase